MDPVGLEIAEIVDDIAHRGSQPQGEEAEHGSADIEGPAWIPARARGAKISVFLAHRRSRSSSAKIAQWTGDQQFAQTFRDSDLCPIRKVMPTLPGRSRL